MTQIYRLNTIWDAKGKSVKVVKEVLGTDARLIDAWETYHDMGYDTRPTSDENLTVMCKGKRIVYLEVMQDESDTERNSVQSDWANSIVC
jgi:hypothetical protein